MDNVKGRTAAFATFSPFRGFRHRCLEWVALAFAPGNDPAARNARFLHTAHFSPVSPRQLRRAGISGHALKHGALLFISAYNGDAESYFRGFNDKLFEVMDEVWMRCVEWRGAKDYKDLNAFITKFCRRADAFFNAYPDESTRIRASLVLHRQVDRLCAIAQSNASDEEFKRALIAAAQIHWGNKPLSRDEQ